MRRTMTAAVAASVMVLGATHSARASGFEYPDNGSVAMGRGGAFTARASDPTALMHNVAGIVGLRGFQLTVSSNFAYLTHCFQRTGTYEGSNENVSIDTTGTRFENSTYSDIGAAYPRVCNEPGLFPAPQLLATYRINDQWAIGFGVYGPNAIGRQTFPTDVMAGGMAAPSPQRYMLLRSDLLILHPTLAVAWAPVRWLRVGLAVQPSIAHFRFATIVNDTAQSAQSPNGDILTELDGLGFFMAGNLGIQVLPSPYVSFGLHVHANQPPTLGGTATATTNIYASDMSRQVRSNFTIERMEAALPVQVRLGARFAMPRVGGIRQNDVPAGQTYDPMRDDVFDVELDFIYESSSMFRSLRLTNSGEINLGTTSVPAPRTLEVPHNWNDVFGVRLGSDVNIVPDRFAMRLGVSYESGAQSNQDAHIDIPAYNSVGLHLGATLRTGPLVTSLGFGQFFMANHVADQGRLATIASMGPVTPMQCMGAGAGPGACTNNRGTYSASLTVFNVGITLRF